MQNLRRNLRRVAKPPAKPPVTLKTPKPPATPPPHHVLMPKRPAKVPQVIPARLVANARQKRKLVGGNDDGNKIIGQAAESLPPQSPLFSQGSQDSVSPHPWDSVIVGKTGKRGHPCTDGGKQENEGILVLMAVAKARPKKKLVVGNDDGNKIIGQPAESLPQQSPLFSHGSQGSVLPHPWDSAIDGKAGKRGHPCTDGGKQEKEGNEGIGENKCNESNEGIGVLSRPWDTSDSITGGNQMIHSRGVRFKTPMQRESRRIAQKNRGIWKAAYETTCTPVRTPIFVPPRVVVKFEMAVGNGIDGARCDSPPWEQQKKS